MKNRVLVMAAFLIMAGFQWYIPWNMSRDIPMSEGNIYKFEMVPFDRNDPFRGKYLQLRFEADRVKMDTMMDFKSGEEIYAVLDQDSAGFVRIQSVEREIPMEDLDFIITRVHMFNEKDTTVILDFSFDRYYLNENLARTIEDSYQHRFADSAGENYAVVKVNEGRAILEEVFIDGKAIQDWGK